MATVEISQINSMFRTALGESAGTFRKASNDNNAMIGKITRDLSRVFAQQKNQISSLNDNMEEVSHHSQQTSMKIDKLASILSESVSLQSQMMSQMRNMVDGIQITNRSVFGVQNALAGPGNDTVVGKLFNLYTLLNTFVPIIGGIASLGAAFKILGEKFGVNVGDFTGGNEAGGATGATGAAGVKQVSNPVMAKDIYNYLTKEKGVDHTHAVGILANIQNESQFNSGAIGDNRTSGGLFQHHNERFTAMRQAAGEDWQHNWKGQIDYAMTEKDMQQYLKTPLSTGAAAASAFVYQFERPKDKSGQAASRAANVPAVERLISGEENKTGKAGKGGGSENPIVTPSASDGSTPKDAQRVEHNHGAEDHAKKETTGNLPSGNLISLGKALEGQGLAVTEHPAFGGVSPTAHGRNSAHYQGNAIDINIPGVGPEASNAQASARFDKLADALTAAGYNVLWKVHGHYDHIHAQLGNRGVKGGFWKGGGGAAAASQGSSGMGTQGATTAGSPATETTPGSSGASESAGMTNPLEGSAFFSELQGLVKGMSGQTNIESIMGKGSSMFGMASALGEIPGMGAAGSILSMLGPLMSGGQSPEAAEPTGEMLQSISNQSSELNKQAVVKEAQNQISTEIATRNDTNKAVEDVNTRNSNRNEGLPDRTDYNVPSDKHLVGEWMQPLRSSWYDQFMGGFIKGA